MAEFTNGLATAAGFWILFLHIISVPVESTPTPGDNARFWAAIVAASVLTLWVAVVLRLWEARAVRRRVSRGGN